jgi:hypothetical protein
MATDGIQAVYLTTHNWGKAARFFQGLGFTLEFDTDHNSGQLRNGPYLFIAEVPENQKAEARIVLKVADADAFRPDAVVDVVTPFEDTHWGTRSMAVRDPDVRIWNLEAPGKRR